MSVTQNRSIYLVLARVHATVAFLRDVRARPQAYIHPGTPAGPTFHSVPQDRQVQVPLGVEKSLGGLCRFSGSIRDNNGER